jgi:hypothetical protein
VTITDLERPGLPGSGPLLGRATPRIWTPPLRTLTPDTSYGFEVIDFAREIGRPLLPWQEFAVVHGGELLEDGRPRFRIVLLLVGRQNGKTELPVVLSIYWQFRKRVPLILGTSTKLAYARESWRKAVNLVRATRSLDAQHEPGRKWYRTTNGETESWTHDECRYLIAASNAEGGRSLTINRGIADELRQHRTYEAWDAFEPACSPEDAQIWALSNAGDSRSVVLNDLQDSAQDFITSGEGDPRLGLLEWSADPDADPEDVDALLQSNPRVGHGQDLDVLLAAARRAKRLGGEALNGFKTERMCVRVKVLRPAVALEAWRGTLDPGPLDPERKRIALCVDVSPDGAHATLAAAQVMAGPLDRVRVELLASWSGPRAASDMERALPEFLRLVKPRTLGWFPNGPAAAVAARMKAPARGVTVEEIRGDTPAVVMGFAKEVTAGTLARSDDALLDDHVTGAEKLPSGGGWVFARSDGAHVDAAYAAAGAVHLARTMPPPRRRSTRVHPGPAG